MVCFYRHLFCKEEVNDLALLPALFVAFYHSLGVFETVHSKERKNLVLSCLFMPCGLCVGLTVEKASNNSSALIN